MVKGNNADSAAGEISALDTAIRLERLARLLRQASHAEGLLPAQWEALRFLARASRFSRSVGAVARYLGTTKGTISQTLQTLEKKGLVTRQARSNDERFVVLNLTVAGTELLTKDPLRQLAGDVEALGGKTRRRLTRGLAEVLSSTVARQKAQSFGTCEDCRYFREKAPGAAMSCMKDGGALSPVETSLLCIEHTER